MIVHLIIGLLCLYLVLLITTSLGKYLDEKEQVLMGKTKSKVKKKKRRLMAAAKANGTENSNGKKKGK